MSRGRSRAGPTIACGLAVGWLAGCATARVVVPSGPGVAFPGFASAYAQAVADCRGVTTLTASMGLSGRAGSTKLRGRIDAGFAAPARIRLEGFPPLMFGGKPYFTLAGRGDDTTLVIDRRVLRGAKAAAVVEALAGVPLDPDQLRNVVAGCGLSIADPAGGRSHESGWAAVDAGLATVYLRQIDARWRIVAATQGPIGVEYADVRAGRPSTVRVRMSAGDGASADITLRLSQVEINTPLDAAVFDVQIPQGAVPMTLDELRKAGPMGGLAPAPFKTTHR